MQPFEACKGLRRGIDDDGCVREVCLRSQTYAAANLEVNAVLPAVFSIEVIISQPRARKLQTWLLVMLSVAEQFQLKSQRTAVPISHSTVCTS